MTRQAAQLADELGLGEPGVSQWPADLIEAHIRAGNESEATRRLEEHSTRAEHTGRTWARATAARCRGLLAGEEDFEAHFAQALRLHDEMPTPFERARTQLCLGERLRRTRRRKDARAPLKDALASFEQLGAAPWAARARSELEASGEPASAPPTTLLDELTPQELQVALIVAQGATNREAGAALFLSPKTIETHLGRTYRKLGLRSRVELATRLAREGVLAADA